MYDLVACGVFKKEIERLLPTLGFSAEVHYLDPGLHINFDMLADTLKSALDECHHPIIVAYGACHPKMSEILAPYNAALLDCQNCIDALITRDKMEELAKKGLYFYLSPGWVDCWRDIFHRLGWGMDEARLELGPFKGAIFIDSLGNASEYENELLEFFDYTLLSYEILPITLDHFKSLLIDAQSRTK